MATFTLVRGGHGMATNAKLRVMDVFDRAVRTHGPRPALRVKRGGAWRTISWDEYHKQVRSIARALMAVGLRKGDGVAIIGYNCPEWFFTDIGAIYAGAVPAGIYTTSSPEQCEYIANHCEATVVFVDDKDQLAKFLAVRSKLVLVVHEYDRRLAVVRDVLALLRR